MILIQKEWALDGSRIIDPETEPRIAWIDIETKKVPAPKSWPYRLRWQPFMIAEVQAIDPGILLATVWANDGEAVLIKECAWDGYEVRYAATRDFDQMVLRGRFTNARRALNPKPGRWPNLDAEDIQWRNMAKVLKPQDLARPLDVPSKDVPKAWLEERYHETVAIHCFKDALDVFLRDPEVHLSRRLRAKLETEFEWPVKQSWVPKV